MAYRTGSATDTADLLEQLRSFLISNNEYRDINVTGTGTGTLESYGAIDLAPTEDWVLTCTAVGPSATFSVEGSLSGIQADATSEVAYDNSIVNFTITDGASDWAIDDTITFNQVKNMGDETPYLDMGTRYTPQSIYQSDTGDVFLPYHVDHCTRVPGKHAGEYGIRLNNTSLQNQTVGMLGETVTEAIWDNLPGVWSISFWVQNTRTYAPINRNSNYAWNHSYGGSRLSFAGSYFSTSKQSIDISVGYNYTAINNTVRFNSTIYSDRILTDTPANTNIRVGNTWELITITNDGAQLKLYIDGSELDSYVDSEVTKLKLIMQYIGTGNTAHELSSTYVQGDHYYREKGGRQKFNGHIQTLYDICVWDKALDSAEVLEIFNDVGAVELGATDLRYKIILDNYAISNVSLYNNNSLGGTSIFSFGFQNLSGYSEDLPSIRYKVGTSSAVTKDTLDITGRENALHTIDYLAVTANTNDYMAVTYDTMQHGITYSAARKSGEPIEKFWFVADTDRIIILYKIHDTGATSQKDPVYQAAYLGLLSEDGQSNNTPACLGTYDDKADWESVDPDFTNGLHNSVSGRIYTGGDIWQQYETDIGGDRETELRNIGNTHYLWPISYYELQGTDRNTNEKVVWQNIYIGYQQTISSQQFGSPKGVYKVSPYNVVAEDIITVDAEDYLVFSDVWATTVGDWFALKLT